MTKKYTHLIRLWCQDIRDSYLVEEVPNNLGNALPTTPERKHLFLLEVFPLENIKYFNEPSKDK